MIPLALATVAAIGTFLLYSSLALGRRGFRVSTAAGLRRVRRRAGSKEWLAQAGLDEVNRREFAGAVAMLSAITGVAGYAAFGGILPAVMMAAFGASFPVAAIRHRRQTRRLRAQEAWPRLIEEIRVQTSSLGRSIPQALFDVGGRGPEELRPAFAAAHREWLLTTDLERTFVVLKARLADPTADMACETLLVAHELGGADLDRRLEALAQDRLDDTQGRKDARSRQAGARFARVFVLLVPAGMAAAGTSIGNGRDAYQTATGQMVVLVALSLVIGCWGWAGRIMQLPEVQRVFKD